MPDPTLPTTCLRLFSHGPHQTQTGPCEGIRAQDRTAQLAQYAAEVRAELHPQASTECPHTGCVHDAATPDAAHHMDPDLVASLQAMAAHHGPRGLQLALEALWPELVPHDPRGELWYLSDSVGNHWKLYADGWWKSDGLEQGYGSRETLRAARGTLAEVYRG